MLLLPISGSYTPTPSLTPVSNLLSPSSSFQSLICHHPGVEGPHLLLQGCVGLMGTLLCGELGCSVLDDLPAGPVWGCRPLLYPRVENVWLQRNPGNHRRTGQPVLLLSLISISSRSGCDLGFMGPEMNLFGSLPLRPQGSVEAGSIRPACLK